MSATYEIIEVKKFLTANDEVQSVRVSVRVTLEGLIEESSGGIDGDPDKTAIENYAAVLAARAEKNIEKSLIPRVEPKITNEDPSTFIIDPAKVEESK